MKQDSDISIWSFYGSVDCNYLKTVVKLFQNKPKEELAQYVVCRRPYNVASNSESFYCFNYIIIDLYHNKTGEHIHHSLDSGDSLLYLTYLIF